jgi:hypothetical protein
MDKRGTSGFLNALSNIHFCAYMGIFYTLNKEIKPRRHAMKIKKSVLIALS